jgi:uncharacterized membrane protein YkvA (DUF1232 family)
MPPNQGWLKVCLIKRLEIDPNLKGCEMTEGEGKVKSIRAFTRTIKQEIQVYQRVLRDSRTPWYAKAVLGLAVGYLLLPFDLIPDFIPVLGQLDDLLIVPGLVWLALKLIPPEVVDECRKAVTD